jgi:hypothetical protein
MLPQPLSMPRATLYPSHVERPTSRATRVPCPSVLALALVLSVWAPAAGQTAALEPPKEIFGTWIWNPSSKTELDNYVCYLERIEDVGGGRTRVRDYRIRLVKGSERLVIRNDFDVFFNTPVMRPDRTSILWRITGPRHYQLMTLPARGGLPSFVVSRDISPDGQRMTQVGSGVVNGATVRSESVFNRAPEGTTSSGDCSLE